MISLDSSVSDLVPVKLIFTSHCCSDWTSSTVASCDKASDTDPWNDSRWTWDPKLYPKHYDIELKPLFSAFRVKALGATALRAFLVNYLPLVEAYIQPDEDDLEDEAEHPPKLPPDPSVAFRQSLRSIVREVGCSACGEATGRKSRCLSFLLRCDVKEG